MKDYQAHAEKLRQEAAAKSVMTLYVEKGAHKTG
jgi:hypothetical protein